MSNQVVDNKCSEYRSFKTIYSNSNPYGFEMHVKWCKRCGAVRIDEEVDNRVYKGSIRKIEFVDKDI